MAKLNIKLVKSLNGRIAKHKATAEALGLRKIGDTTVQPDNAATTGASSTARNQNTLHYTFTAPRKCVYEGDTEDLLTVKAALKE